MEPSQNLTPPITPSSTMSSPTRRRPSQTHLPEHDKTRIDHTLDLSLFSPQHLSTEEGLQTALVALDRSWWQDELRLLEITVRKLMAGHHNLFPYVIAIALDDARYDRLLSMLLRTFPSTADAFLSSLACDLVNYLRNFYIGFFCSDVPRNLDEYHRTIPLTLNAFRALKDLKLDNDASRSVSCQDEKIEGVTYKVSQRKKKHAKQQSRMVPTDATPFLAIGADVPRTSEEVTDLVDEMLDAQKTILKGYLRVLRFPILASSIEKLYILSEIPPLVQPAGPEVVTPEATGPARDISAPLEIHPAYPQIQPLKAAKYFSEPAEGFGHWHLLLSSRAIQHLKSFHRDQTQWTAIKKKMQALSNGVFSDSNQKKLLGSDLGVPIYEAKLLSDLRLIYQIDIAPDDATGNDHQVIKVWGIHTHAQMDKRLWKSISYHQSKIDGEYRRRCLFRETAKHPGNNVVLPASWDTIVEKLPIDAPKDQDMTMRMTTEEQLELHSILALEKFTRMSQALMNSIVAGQDDTYPFELTGSEQQIRDHPSSCFVLGRSGTGKTTTMVFKMIAHEMANIQQAAEIDGPPAPKYRQLFVTQSRILAGRVQDYFGKMLMSQSAGQKSSQEIERLALRNQRASDGDDVLDLDEDEEDERSDLPKKFSELEDHHFPLFLTIDQLCKLLESDFNLTFKRQLKTKEHRRAEQRSRSVDIEDEIVDIDDDDLAKDDNLMNMSPLSSRLAEKASIITFETFFYAYWPHFPQPLTKGLDPALVWNEFMGVIKGSEESLDMKDGLNFLDKATYLNLSHRRQSTFAKQRERIYGIFECYLKLKRKRGDYDAADRTHAILRALDGFLPGGRQVDFLYVDEAQDNLIVDACRMQLCGNADGFFWAGDTAQTISMGSSFRFDDLKSFLYRLEEKSSGLRAHVHPESFQLAINYRSHAGVVNCAHSVVELITQFWPDSLDKLSRERGVVDGPQPVFFCGWDSKVARYEQFLFHESGNIEFGAQQCILVRDEKAREDLRREIGEVGLIMTLYESKGLEFNDVLLFNFFTDSTATLAEWRVILNAVDESKRGNVGVPQFDETRHSSLCSELKSLYVGITRARCHVWILDVPNGSEEKGEPMRVFWESHNLIQTCRPGDPVPELAVRSTPEQWGQQGRALFKTKHFQLAIFCFERAGLILERLISHAHLLRRIAQRIPPGQETHKNAAYLRAAEAFVVCTGMSSSSAARLKYFDLGADCFVTAGAHTSAAQAYLGARSFTKAAQQFKKAKLFDEAADVVLLHRGKVDSNVADECLSIAKLHLHREHQHRKATRLFDSIDEQLLYLEEYGFDIARTTILEDLERWNDAAEIHYAEGRPLDAISRWIRAGDAESRRRARSGLLDSLWITLPLGKEPDENQQNRLLQLLRTLGPELVDQTQCDESEMFLAIFAKDYAQLLRLAREFCHGIRRNPMAALLCFDHALKRPPQMRNDGGQSVARCLEDYDLYAHLMHKVILDSLKTQWSYATRLLGFTETQDGTATRAQTELHVLSSSILYESLKNRDTSVQSIDDSISVTSSRLSTVIREVLGQRLRQRLLDEHDICLHSRSFRPCLNFGVYGNCGRVECHREHVTRESSSEEAFNLRTRLHMQQILIVHNMEILLEHGDRRKLRRIWQERLFEVLFPSFYVFGHISVLSKSRYSSSLPGSDASSGLWNSSIPEHQRAAGVLSTWLSDRFYSLRPFRDDRDDKFMTDAVQTAILAFAVDRRNAVHYLRRADCVVKQGHPRLQRNGGYVIHDLLTFLEGSSETSVAHGSLFIKHILDQRIPIDINTLLTVLEAVVGRAIIACCPSLHYLTLPRTWMVNLLSNWNERCRIKPSFIRSIFGPLAGLMEGIYSNKGVDHLIFDGRPLSTLRMPSAARTVMIFRICKCLALLGYNIRITAFRYDVGKTLASLSKPERTFPSLISPYIKANEWADVSRAVRSSTESPLDELIVLCKAEKLPNIYHPPRGTRLVRFNSISEVLPALEYVTASKFNPEAKPFVPSTAGQPSALLPDVEPAEDDSAADDETFREEARTEVIAPNDLSIKRTEEEIVATGVIQAWYRSKLAARSLETNEILTSRLRLYAACQEQVEKLQISRSYRHMFLGPLSHILTVLQGCKKALSDTKRSAKKLLAGTGVLDLDRVHALISKSNTLTKTQIRLSKALEPASKSHHTGSVENLRKHVEEVNGLVKDTLSLVPSMQDFWWDMEVGYKGIVRLAPPPRPTAKAMKRPSLNTEDIDI